jgi:carbon-monoxide dehydrogenase medium subunit
MWKKYITASSVDEVLNALAEHGERARVVAGATDLILEIELGVRKGIDVLIDVTRIPNQKYMILDDEGLIHLGPLVTHNDCVASDLIRQRALPLAQASWEVGAPQIRNRSTVAGNLITASPANDTITPLMALGASVVLRSQKAERTVPLSDFYAGLRQTVMQPDEMLVDIHFPALDPQTQRGAFIKLALRRAQAISVVNAAVILKMDDDVIADASVTLGAVTPVIVHAEATESFLAGRRLNVGTIEKAAELALESASPIDDVRSSAAYRVEMVKVAVRRILNELAQSKQDTRMPDHPIILNGAAQQDNSTNPISIVHQAEEQIEANINGKKLILATGQDKTLLRWLREDALLIGTKEGCAEGECGACTVFLDGEAVMSCLVPAPRAHGAEIVTIEGLSMDDQLHPMQQAFIEDGAVQCGYCTPGFIMSGAKLLEERPNPSLDDAQQAITGNLCRCTGYYKILEAIQHAGQLEVER